MSFVCVADFDCQFLSCHGKPLNRWAECLVELYSVCKPQLDQLISRVRLVSQYTECSSLQIPCNLVVPRNLYVVKVREIDEEYN